MNHYLSLIPISAKVHRRQNRMTLLCIIFSVFMVTAVFSMAEIGARMEQARLSEKHGSLSVAALFDSAMGQTLLLTAIILFFLVLAAGVLMISSSINSSIAQRTKFFGMMRCIGMSQQQIVLFVRLEALNWCKTAVPIGLVLGTAASWTLCAALHFLVGEEFSNIPLFGISGIGIVSGIAVGVVSVLIAASAPAKRAAKVPSVTAASGNSDSSRTWHHTAKLRFFKIETALGCYHALSSKKNLLLLTGSFALSIVLFLSFSVMIDFVNYLMPQSSGTPDIELVSSDDSHLIAPEITDALNEVKGVRRVYGRRSRFTVPAEINGNTALSDTVDLVSFDDFDLECLAADNALKSGSDLSKVYGDSRFVLAAWDPSSPLKVGDQICVGDEKLEIAGLLRYDPFSSDGLTHGTVTLILSGETFVRLTGSTGYSLVMLQVADDIPEESIEEIQNIAGATVQLRDKRSESTAGTHLAFVACVYSFLFIIALVTVLNMINRISMSVSAKIKQYGAMRAVGMGERQMTKMILAEALTYAFCGCAVGCAFGLVLSKALYDFLITKHFPYVPWTFPLARVRIVILFVLTAAIAAAYAPAKRIRKLSITETINEL